MCESLGAFGAALLLHNTGMGQVKNDPHGGNLPDITAALSNAEDKIRELENRAGTTTIPL